MDIDETKTAFAQFAKPQRDSSERAHKRRIHHRTIAQIDVEELLAERDLHGDHVTVWRWVQRYAPELQRCLRRHLKPTNDSWRMDETYVRVKGKWRYLYR